MPVPVLAGGLPTLNLLLGTLLRARPLRNLLPDTLPLVELPFSATFLGTGRREELLARASLRSNLDKVEAILL